MKASELKTFIDGIQTQVEKAKGEILAKIKALEDSLADVDLPEDATSALDALKTSVQGVDDIVPDAPTEPTNG